MRIGHILRSSLNPRNEQTQLNPSVILRVYSTPVDPSSRRHTTTSSELDSSGATNYPVHKYKHVCKQVLTESCSSGITVKSSIHNLPVQDCYKAVDFSVPATNEVEHQHTLWLTRLCIIFNKVIEVYIHIDMYVYGHTHIYM